MQQSGWHQLRHDGFTENSISADGCGGCNKHAVIFTWICYRHAEPNSGLRRFLRRRHDDPYHGMMPSQTRQRKCTHSVIHGYHCVHCRWVDRSVTLEMTNDRSKAVKTKYSHGVKRRCVMTTRTRRFQRKSFEKANKSRTSEGAGGWSVWKIREARYSIAVCTTTIESGQGLT